MPACRPVSLTNQVLPADRARLHLATPCAITSNTEIGPSPSVFPQPARGAHAAALPS